MALTPRPYQREALDALLAAYRRRRATWRHGVPPADEPRDARGAIGIAATGMGKTIIAACHEDALRGAYGIRRALFLAHRTQLLEQAAATWATWTTGRRVVRYESGVTDYGDVTLATRPGAHSALDRLPLAEYDLVIVDEAHHLSLAAQYGEILDAIWAVNPRMHLVGLTATAAMADRRHYGHWFRSVAFEFGLEYGIRNGWLVGPTEWVRLALDLDGEDVRTAAGTIRNRAIRDAFAADAGLDFLVRAWHDHRPGWEHLATLAYVPDVATARALAARFVNSGVNAAWISDKCSNGKRAEVFNGLHDGTLDVVANVDLLTEGFDCARVGRILAARPTTAAALVIQAVGRAARLLDNAGVAASAAAGKGGFQVLDAVGWHAVAPGLAVTIDLEGDEASGGVDEPTETDREPDAEPAAREIRPVEIVGASVYHVDILGTGQHAVPWYVLPGGVRVAPVTPTRAVLVYPVGDVWHAVDAGYAALDAPHVTPIAPPSPYPVALAAASAAVGRPRHAADAPALRAPAARERVKQLRRLAGDDPRGAEAPVDPTVAQADAWIAYLQARRAYRAVAAR